MKDRAGPSGGREYRIGELADAAGIPVRTVRYYRERRLLPEPRRDGRANVYSEVHLERLRIVGRLLARGHTLETVGQLLAAWEQGHDVAELIGFEREVTAPWSQETPVSMSVPQLLELFGEQITPPVLEEATALGYLRVEGETVTFESRRLLDTAVGLVREGIPLTAVLTVAHGVQEGLDRLASLFVGMVVSHAGAGGGSLSPDEVSGLAERVRRLRPLARIDIDAEFGRAMDRCVRREFDRLIGELAAPDPPAPYG